MGGLENVSNFPSFFKRGVRGELKSRCDMIAAAFFLACHADEGKHLFSSS
ncbi:MAG: hypothetical protein ACJATE_000442 [Bacteroidia bacterium]|jgi:hypothetical protein